ncbi:hypothetical protein KSP39_PZI011046 [Platanthera zijinensis]|uniref:Mur ligase N-terminal catalytic domain-containing protein n=1 Tax=Platanthera zijinensis TaxID=2320716 RepID=A0AAP0BHC3_9ASPA
MIHSRPPPNFPGNLEVGTKRCDDGGSKCAVDVGKMEGVLEEAINLDGAAKRQFATPSFPRCPSSLSRSRLYLLAKAARWRPPSPANANAESSSGDNPFGDIDHAISLERQKFVKQGLLPSKPPRSKNEVIHGLTKISMDEIEKEKSIRMLEKEDKAAATLPNPPSFELDLDSLSKSRDQILESNFKMMLAELLDESRVVPVSVHGHLKALITGIQHDHKEVSSGDLFIRCAGASTDGHDSLTKADERGAVAVVADKEINLERETLALKALLIVEDTDLVLPVLADSFYRNPSRSLYAIGITGTHGKTGTSFLSH